MFNFGRTQKGWRHAKNVGQLLNWKSV